MGSQEHEEALLVVLMMKMVTDVKMMMKKSPDSLAVCSAVLYTVSSTGRSKHLLSKASH